jgi:UDP-N-acetylglucosamine 4,6-dehydratase
MILRSIRRLSDTGRAGKRSILLAYDLTAMVVALFAAFWTRLGEPYLPDNVVLVLCAAASFAIGLAALYRLRVYHLVVRYFDMRAVNHLMVAAAVAALSFVILVYYTRAPVTAGGIEILVPRTVGFIYAGYLFLLLFMGRYVMALLLALAWRETALNPMSRTHVAIYGANSAGISLANSMRSNPDFRLTAFIDDDKALQGQIIAGVPVYAPGALPELARTGQIRDVFLALPNATRSQRLAAISRLTELNLSVKTIPAPEELMSGRYTVSDVRPIDVSDLLRRDPVQPLSGLIREAVEGHTILVTGAGGSIGSEICRQILAAMPRRLVLLDHSEFGLYAIEQELEELRAKLPQGALPEICPVVGSMLNERLVRRIIAEHRVDTIYHAAAYKHVPLLEQNEAVGVENNVFGTLVLASAAIDAKLTRFTMISTDKAVRPKSVMGASKRVAELIVQAFAARPGCETRFGIVRFGNVLDSSGSVVQRFRSQIQEGGPVTVTHRDITRFFMSIPEATQLVLQASAMAHHGEVFVLDMGEPIRIADLARNMITLSGMTVRDEHNPMGDIEIVYVGLRPGEKLYEELFVGQDSAPTTHPRILMARERSISLEELTPHLDGLRRALDSSDGAAVRHCLDPLLTPEGGGLASNVTVLRRA